MKGKRMFMVTRSALFALVFVLAAAGCSSVSSSSTADDSSWESRLARATTFEEVRQMYEYAPRGSEVQKAAKKKFEAILTPRLAAATTLEEVRGMYLDAPYGSGVQKAVVEKMLSLATTFEEVAREYRNAPEGSEVKKAAVEKLGAILTPT